MSLINRKIIKKIKTTVFISSYNSKDLEAFNYLYVVVDENPKLPIRQFISKSNEKIRYNIYIINITEEIISDIESVDNLPEGAKIQKVTLDGEEISFSPTDTSINFKIPSIEGQRYSKIIIEIDNDPDVKEKANSMYILKPEA